jgi:hypothetical protein
MVTTLISLLLPSAAPPATRGCVATQADAEARPWSALATISIPILVEKAIMMLARERINIEMEIMR